MADYEAGFHKKISSIFDGVPVQKQPANPGGQQTSLPDFVTDSREASEPTQSYHQQPRPVQKLYKDTAEKPHKLISKINSQKDTVLSRIYRAFRAKLLPKKSSVKHKRQQGAIVLVPVLCLVLVFVLFKFVLSSPPKKINAHRIQAAVSEVLEPVKINWQIPPLISALLRDPMKPATLAGVSDPVQTIPPVQVSSVAIELTGIVYSEDNPAAIIGTQIMHAGEKIGDVSIVKVEKDAVTFEWKGQTKTLRVSQSWLPADQTQ
jgi:hypothetical protein